jgi:hypothetical protein
MTETLSARLLMIKTLEGLKIINPLICDDYTGQTQLLLTYSRTGDCCICMDTKEDLCEQECQLYSTPCSHLICHVCLIKFIDKNWQEHVDVTCPVCRVLLLKNLNELIPNIGF